MRVWSLLIIALLHSSLNSNPMQSAHGLGVGVVNSLVSGVQGAAKAADISRVPGYATSTPPETTINDQNIGEATFSKTRTEPVATYVKEHSANREMYKLDSLTDPMFVNANESQVNPDKTMQETLSEEEVSQTETTEECECEEGGDEYIQKCSKRRVVEIEIIPEKKTSTRYCPGHEDPNRSSKNRGKRDNLRWHNSGCLTQVSITQTRQVRVIKDEWIDDCAPLEEKADQGLCRYVEAQMGAPETRTLVGKVISPEAGQPDTEAEPIARDSWAENYTYACMYQSKNGCEILRKRGCVQKQSTCIERVGDICVAWRKTYTCVKNKRNSKRYKSADGKTLFCLTGDCSPTDYEVNGELAEALVQMAVLKEAQEDIRSNVGIFKGVRRQCNKNCLDFRDCCKNGKGWGVNLHLASCSGEEKELADWRQKNRCIFIGTYCAEKILGKCTRKKSSFCCFGTKLAKLINEQGRRQLGIGFGNIKLPDCRGLTPEELSRIDMSRMDLSELYADVMEKFKVQPQEHQATGMELERIKENMQHLAKRSAQKTL